MSHKFANKKTIIILSLVLIASVAVAIFSLRANNLQMLNLKQTVMVADEQNGDVELALENLRSYVNGHMNTTLRSSTSNEPPIQLVNRFNRAVAAEQARISALGGANKVYTDAQAQCENASIPLTARAQCIQNYVTDNGKGLPQLNLPPKELYTFDFASPVWSPDLAGWAIVLSGISLICLIVSIILAVINKKRVRN